MSTRRGKVFASILGSSLKLGLRFCLPMAFFLLSLLSLALIGSLSLSTADEFIFQICRKERNYTANSPFQKNIEGLIASLSSLAPATGFAIDTVGEVPDRVYGLAVCRADIDGAKCRGCLAGAAQGAAPACPGNKGATVFYDLCHLRYSDQSFFGESTGTEYYMTNPQNASDVPTFNRLLGRLLNNLTTRAASSERMFAAGVVDFTDFQKVYALVQCTRDLSPETCDACLRSEISYIPVCCEAKQGARVAGGSCFLRYEVYPFFTAAADTPAAAPPSLLPKNTPPVRIPAAEDKKSNTLTIPLSISIALVFSLAILAAIGIYMWRTRQRKPLGGREEGDANQSDSFQFSFEALKLATLNFSNQNKLGEGGFGVVYKVK